VKPGQKVEWPYALTPEERALGVNGIRQKYIWSMLSELGDVTDPSWPSPETLKKFDRMNRSDFCRSRGVRAAQNVWHHRCCRLQVEAYTIPPLDILITICPSSSIYYASVVLFVDHFLAVESHGSELGAYFVNHLVEAADVDVDVAARANGFV
jgi:hypothetical protein